MRGLDAYLTREPDTRDEFDPQREEEAAREERWTDFVAWLRELGRESHWDVVLWRVADTYWGEAEDATITDFADAEGWPSVLSAVARAMHEQAAEAAEIERRR